MSRAPGDAPGTGALIEEIRQSCYLLALMAAVPSVLLGLGLFAVRVLG